MQQTVGPVSTRYPGNKRKLPVLVDGQGEDVLRSDKLRSAYIKNLPAVILGAAISNDSILMEAIVGASFGEKSLARLIGRLPVRGRFGFDLMVSAAVVAAEQGSGRDQAGRMASFRLINPAPLCEFEDGALEADDPKRWRGLGWRVDAAETVVSIAAGRCLFSDCSQLIDDEHRRYCHYHGVKSDRSASDLAAKRHDNLLEAAADLLKEVAEIMPVKTRPMSGSVPEYHLRSLEADWDEQVPDIIHSQE